MMKHRALFVGAIGPAAVAAMHGWLDAGHEIAAFWRGATPTPGPARRDRRLSFVLPRHTVAGLSRRRGFPVRDVRRLSSWPEAAAEARATGADVLISVYFPYLIPQGMLDAFGDRAVNLHPAPLPRYRGPSPVQAMVLDRTVLTDGAMTLHVLAAGLDEGAIVAQEPVAFPRDLSIQRYGFALAGAAARLAGDALPRYLAGGIRAVPQDAGKATYVKVSTKEMDLSLDLPAEEIRWRCLTFAQSRPIGIAGIEGVQIAAFLAVLGPPTGRPPVVGPFSVEFDAADARVRLRRKLPLMRQVRRARGFMMMLAEMPISLAGGPRPAPQGLPPHP